jgi:hypothetical protein
MRLVRVTHYRCSDYDCNTFALAPDEWDEVRIKREVGLAQDAYLEQFAKAMENDQGPPRVGHVPPYDKHPDRTVAEVRAEHEAAKAEWEAWEAELRRQRRSFEAFLEDRGFTSLWNEDASVLVECDWGHRHGQRLAYGNDREIDTMPSPAKLAGAYDVDDFA